ncbi:hypothetical protein ABPG77_008262 [Micractinium sp. CCAP 211/92]
MDAAAALSSAAGAVKHGVQAAGHAAGAALAAAQPLAGKASQGAAMAAGTLGSQAAQAAASLLGNSELVPPEVAMASNDSCAQALGIRKVALMFLVKGPMQHEQAWRRWFASAGGVLPINATLLDRPVPASAAAAAAGSAAVAHGVPQATAAAVGFASAVWPDLIGRQHLFAVYIHAPPSFKGYPPGSLFAGRLIPRRIPTGWGDISLVEATRNLLWEAFRDPMNERFVLLSESDIPLYDPLTLHQQLLAERKSRVNACLHNNRFERRWSDIMKTEHMNASHWRKSTQWFGLTRPHAEAVLRDEEVYRSFEAGCWSNWEPGKPAWRDCFPDEHYFATLFAVLGREAEMDPGEVTPELVRRLRGANCSGEAAFADAQRLYIDAARALGAKSEHSCQALQAARAAAGAGYAHPLNAAACHVTARKFPANTAAAVLRLFSPEVSCPRDGSGGLRMVSERYCRQQQEQQRQWQTASALKV